MKNLSKNKKISLIFIALTVFVTLFIFSNSLRNGEESSKQSGFVVTIVETMAKMIGIDFDKSSLSHFIRKFGHFSEYFLLGAISALAIYFWFEQKKLIVFAPIYSLIVALCDEFICQNMTPGRSPQYTDVLIDFCGTLFAIFICWSVLTFIAKKKTKQLFKNG